MSYKNNIKEIDEKIKIYYMRCEKIKMLEYEIEILNNLKNKLIKDIEKTNIILDINLYSNNYIEDKVQTSIKDSQQERALCKAIINIENQIKEINIKIKGKNNFIHELQIENLEIGSIINKLDSSSKDIIENLYKNKNSSVKLGYKLKFADSTIRKKKQKILIDILKWYNWTKYC